MLAWNWLSIRSQNRNLMRRVIRALTDFQSWQSSHKLFSNQKAAAHRPYFILFLFNSVPALPRSICVCGRRAQFIERRNRFLGQSNTQTWTGNATGHGYHRSVSRLTSYWIILLSGNARKRVFAVCVTCIIKQHKIVFAVAVMLIFFFHLSDCKEELEGLMRDWLILNDYRAELALRKSNLQIL